MKVRLVTDNPIAVHSPDHLDAANGGSGNDNSHNPLFNEKLATLYGRKISVLDVGCAGGGFVNKLLEQGYFAVGLEGSDYCQKRKKFEWSHLDGTNLFTCDATKPFRIVSNLRDDNEEDKPNDVDWNVLFDLVTFWEVMEHFSEEELPGVINNVKNHLAEGGVWLMSVSTQADRKFHRCVKNKAWWLDMFAGHGLHNDDKFVGHFGDDWVRGPKQTPWAIVAADSFHLAMRVR